MGVGVKVNYSAFYVSKPFSESNLGANSTHDFVYYNMLRMWRGEDKIIVFLLMMHMIRHIMCEMVVIGKRLLSLDFIQDLTILRTLFYF